MFQQHPILMSLAGVVALVYIAGAYLMFQSRNARPGYEDEDGFHFLEEIEEVVIYPDEERPVWLTSSLVQRFSGHVEITPHAA